MRTTRAAARIVKRKLGSSTVSGLRRLHAIQPPSARCYRRTRSKQWKAAAHNETGVTARHPGFTFLKAQVLSGTVARAQRYMVLIAPQLPTRAPGAAAALAALAVPPGVLIDPNEFVAPELVVPRGAAPMTEQRYISFVAVSVISPLATAAAISSSEKSWRGV